MKHWSITVIFRFVVSTYMSRANSLYVRVCTWCSFIYVLIPKILRPLSSKQYHTRNWPREDKRNTDFWGKVLQCAHHRISISLTGYRVVAAFLGSTLNRTSRALSFPTNHSIGGDEHRGRGGGAARWPALLGESAWRAVDSDAASLFLRGLHLRRHHHHYRRPLRPSLPKELFRGSIFFY